MDGATEADPVTGDAAEICRMLMTCREGVISGREPVVDWYGTGLNDPAVTLCVRLSRRDRDAIVASFTEIERLRAALQRIISDAESDNGMTAWDGADIAREALRIGRAEE